MKRTLGILAFLICTAMVFGCAGNIILPEQEPLIGNWEGTYSVILNHNSPTDEVVHWDYVLFYFGETTFIMSPDLEKHRDGVCFCYGYGTYLLTDGIRFKMISSQPRGEIGCQSCNSEEDPDGTFRKEDQNGTLVLKQLIGSTYKVLELKRVVSNDE